jgi:hypothetical protein
LKPPPAVATDSLSAEDFATHLMAKVNSIRAATASAPVPDIKLRTIPCLSDFEAVTTAEFMALLKKVPPKHCALTQPPLG